MRIMDMEDVVLINGKILAEASTESIHSILVELYNRTDQTQALITALAATQSSMAASVQSISVSIKSMAETQEKGEARYAKLEDRLQATNDRAAGKNQIPLVSHLAILFSSVLITVLIVLYVHQQSIDASLTSIKVQPVKP